MEHETYTSIFKIFTCTQLKLFFFGIPFVVFCHRFRRIKPLKSKPCIKKQKMMNEFKLKSDQMNNAIDKNIRERKDMKMHNNLNINENM